MLDTIDGHNQNSPVNNGEIVFKSDTEAMQELVRKPRGRSQDE